MALSHAIPHAFDTHPPRVHVIVRMYFLEFTYLNGNVEIKNIGSLLLYQHETERGGEMRELILDLFGEMYVNLNYAAFCVHTSPTTATIIKVSLRDAVNELKLSLDTNESVMTPFF